MTPARRRRGWPRRLAIVGTGLMGTSVGLAARAAGVAEVVGTDRRRSESATALGAGALTSVAAGAVTAAAGADLVVVATPARTVAAVLAEVGHAAPGSVLTDVAGTKSHVVRALSDDEAVLARLVPGHPMAGSHDHGARAARADLFQGAVWALTPHPAMDPDALRAVAQFVRSLGARPLVIDPVVHDRVVAFASHLPQLTATALMDAVGDANAPAALERLIAAGFRDTTRVAASDPRVWVDICATNRDAILAALDALGARVGALRGLVAAGDDEGLLELLERARRARRRLPAKPGAPRGLALVSVYIADRPGSLARVTALLGESGINVEDLAIDHELAGRGGVLQVWVVRGAELRARAALEGAGWSLHEA